MHQHLFQFYQVFVVDGSLQSVIHIAQYPDLTVHLTLFHAAIREGVPQKLEHNDTRWITVNEIAQYALFPADEEILRWLKDAYQNLSKIET